MSEAPPPPGAAIPVPAGTDRHGQTRSVLGGLDIAFKVLPADTGGNLLVLEHTDHHRGGPPRHVHHAQDEWFYVLEGEYQLVVGEEHFALKAGDAVLAPRQVPHVWAHVGPGRGRLIIAFQPAGMMEAFLTRLSQIPGRPTPEQLRQLFHDHGMEIQGPPLALP